MRHPEPCHGARRRTSRPLPWRSRPAVALVRRRLRRGRQDQAGTSTPTWWTRSRSPQLGACLVTSRPEDVALPTNATAVVDCTEEHTAQTYGVGDLPDELHDAEYDSEELGAWAYKTCSAQGCRTSSAPTSRR